MIELINITKEQQALIESYFSNNTKDNNLEGIIQFLKNIGISQLQSAFIIMKFKGLTFKDANSAVLNSEAWNA